MARIYWKSTWSNPQVRVEGRQFVPKRPVLWRGYVWMQYEEDGRQVRQQLDWSATSPIYRKEGQEILKEMLARLLEEHGIGASEAGFEMRCP